MRFLGLILFILFVNSWSWATEDNVSVEAQKYVDFINQSSSANEFYQKLKPFIYSEKDQEFLKNKYQELDELKVWIKAKKIKNKIYLNYDGNEISLEKKDSTLIVNNIKISTAGQSAEQIYNKILSKLGEDTSHTALEWLMPKAHAANYFTLAKKGWGLLKAIGALSGGGYAAASIASELTSACKELREFVAECVELVKNVKSDRRRFNKIVTKITETDDYKELKKKNEKYANYLKESKNKGQKIKKMTTPDALPDLKCPEQIYNAALKYFDSDDHSSVDDFYNDTFSPHMASLAGLRVKIPNFIARKSSSTLTLMSTNTQRKFICDEIDSHHIEQCKNDLSSLSSLLCQPKNPLDLQVELPPNEPTKEAPQAQ